MDGGATLDPGPTRDRPAREGPANQQRDHPLPFPDGLPPRVLGEMGPDGPGPTLIVVSGVHGNEPAGVLGSLQVLDALESRAGELRGRVHFLVGHREALRRSVRYLDRDLNRAWTRERVAALAYGEGSPEDQEQLEFLAELDRILAEADGPVYALDLHTTSGPGGVFTNLGDTLENRALARALPVPLVLGLEELLDGTLHDYLVGRGLTTLAFESGQHLEPEAVDRAEAAIWILLVVVGLLPPELVPELAGARERLEASSRHLPRLVELRYRHPVTDGDGFRMRPGFRSFQEVRRGQVIADDREGRVRVPRSGRLLMPLYQPLGNDGFFVVREIRPFWLGVSKILRRTGAHRVVHLLPGIRRDPLRPGALIINQRVARWYAVQVMHLLGFRRYREEGDTLVVLRRDPPEGG